MKIGWWLLILAASIDVWCVGYIVWQHSDRQRLQGQVAELREDNERLAKANASLNKLKAMTLSMGAEPLHLSGSMWVVFQEEPPRRAR